MPREKPPRIVASESPNPAATWDRQKAEEYGNEKDPERGKIYKLGPNGETRDPILRDFKNSLGTASDEEAATALDAFVKTYPEKAGVYKNTFQDLEHAVRDQRAKRAAITTLLHAPIPGQSVNEEENQIGEQIPEENPVEASTDQTAIENLIARLDVPATDQNDSIEVTPLKNEREVPHEETPEEKEVRERLEAIRERNRVRNEAARKKRAEERERRKSTEGDKKEGDPDAGPENQESKEKSDTESRERQEGRDLIPRPKPEKKNEEPEVTRLKNEREVPRNDGRGERPKNGWQQFAGTYGKKAAGGAAAVGLTVAGFVVGNWAVGFVGSELGLTSVYGGLAAGAGVTPWIGRLLGGGFVDMAVWQFLKLLASKEDRRELIQSFMPFSFMKLPGGGGGGAKKASGGGGAAHAPAGGGGHH